MNKIVFCIVILLSLIFNSAQGKIVPGYIIINGSDTIYGEIKIPQYNIYTNGIVLFGINLEPFHSALNFRENNSKIFKLFTPKDIDGFSFTYRSTEYRFKAFTIVSNSIFKSERKRVRFLNLIYQGDVAIYKNIVRRTYNSEPNLYDDFVEYYDYYIYDDKQGLRKVDSTINHELLIDLLIFYQIDQKLIE